MNAAGRGFAAQINGQFAVARFAVVVHDCKFQSAHSEFHCVVALKAVTPQQTVFKLVYRRPVDVVFVAAPLVSQFVTYFAVGVGDFCHHAAHKERVCLKNVVDCRFVGYYADFADSCARALDVQCGDCCLGGDVVNFLHQFAVGKYVQFA